MSAQPTTSAVAEGEASTSKTGMSLEEKIGMAKKFDREMKDYAKATVKEFLGIYGYEEDVDINMDESETNKVNETSQAAEKQTGTEPSTTTVSTMTNTYEVEKGTGNDRPVSSVSISSSTTNGNADMTRFCITMSIPRPDSLEGYTTLRFWNCIMCSTAFVGTKPEIIQRVHHPQLFTYQPEWLSHAGICNRCQKTLTMQAPKITIYAISETPQHNHGATSSIPGTSVPSVSASGPPMPGVSIAGGSVPGLPIPHVLGTFVPGTYMTGTSVPIVMCNALPGHCNCAHGGHNHVPGVSHLAYQGVNVPVVTKTDANPARTEAGYIANVTQYIPMTCTQ